MGLISQLIPGLRDLRTPLLAGYTWLIALWLLLSDLKPVRDAAAKLQHEFAPLTSAYGPAVLLSVTSVVAYLLGSLFVDSPARGTGLYRIERLLVTPLSRVARRARRYAPGRWRIAPNNYPDPLYGNLLFADPSYSYAMESRFRGQDLKRLSTAHVGDLVERVQQYGELATRDRLRAMDFDTGHAVLNNSKLSDSEREELRTAERAVRQTSNLMYTLFDALDPTSLAVRLHIANRDLWDQYDRLEAEAELRLTLSWPILLLAIGLFVRVAPWVGLVATLVALIIFRVGDQRARQANGVLVQCLVTGVIEDKRLSDIANDARTILATVPDIHHMTTEMDDVLLGSQGESGSPSPRSQAGERTQWPQSDRANQDEAGQPSSG